MRFSSLRVRNYRSIGGEQTVDLSTRLTVVGPNNSGKTNLLRAVRMFFTGPDNVESYDRATDLTFGKTREQTTLVGTFLSEGSDQDLAILDIYDRLLALYEPVRTRESDEFQLQLIFSLTGNATYRLSSDSTSRVPRENQGNHSRLLRQLVEDLVASFSVHYVPSSSNSEQLFDDLVAPLLKRSVASKIRTEVNALVDALDNVSADLTDTLATSGLEQLGVVFGLPDMDKGLYLSHFSFDLKDPDSTSVFDKGRGIQSLAMFACFAWIAEQEALAGKNSIWLVEEPESYLNPELYPNAVRLLEQVGKSAQVVSTTHALGMVPSDHRLIVGSSLDANSRTVLAKFSSPQEATANLRRSLGVRFSDYFALSEFNVFTEGESDTRYLRWAFESLGGPERFPRLAAASLRSFGGTTDLSGFLKANYLHIRPERAVVSVFDGDAAGLKAVRELNGFLVNKGSAFQPNKDYVIVRNGFAIEGLFPDSYLVKMYSEHPGWFDSWMVDAAGEVAEFRLKDSSKKSFEGWAMNAAAEAKSTADWEARWLPVLDSIEAGLEGFGSAAT